MALQISKSVNRLRQQGLVEPLACYWRIGELQIDTLRKLSLVTIHAYISLEARQAGLDPIDSLSVRFDHEHYLFPSDSLISNPIEQAYLVIKTLPEFQEAIDV